MNESPPADVLRWSPLFNRRFGSKGSLVYLMKQEESRFMIRDSRNYSAQAMTRNIVRSNQGRPNDGALAS
jgi:hypothetical protein